MATVKTIVESMSAAYRSRYGDSIRTATGAAPAVEPTANRQDLGETVRIMLKDAADAEIETIRFDASQRRFPQGPGRGSPLESSTSTATRLMRTTGTAEQRFSG